MNDFDETILLMVTWKKKRKAGLKFSTKNAFKGSRVARLTTKARICDFSSVTKKLAFIDRISCERCITDLKGCSSEADCL